MEAHPEELQQVHPELKTIKNPTKQKSAVTPRKREIYKFVLGNKGG